MCMWIYMNACECYCICMSKHMCESVCACEYMYVSTCACVQYVCIHVWVHIHMCECMHTCVSVYIFLRVYLYMCACTYVWVHVHVCEFVCTCVCMHVNACEYQKSALEVILQGPSTLIFFAWDRVSLLLWRSPCRLGWLARPVSTSQMLELQIPVSMHALFKM